MEQEQKIVDYITTATLAILTVAFATDSGDIEQNIGMSVICGILTAARMPNHIKNIIDEIRSGRNQTQR